MGRDDWYRRTTWTRDDAEAFFDRLERSRGQESKAQYARIQALYLEEAGLIEPASSLLDRILSEWPSRFELASTYLQKGTCALRKENIDEALWWFRKALQAEQDFPNVRTQAFLHFSKLVALHRKQEFYGEVARLLRERENDILFPIDRYYSEATLAMIAEDQGDIAAARRHACSAFEVAQRQHSGFRKHPKLGLVKDPDLAFQDTVERLSS